MLRRSLSAFLVLTFLAGAQMGCDSKSKSKSKSEETEDDDDDSKKKKKKGESSSEASSKAPDKPIGVEVPGIAGFVVPAGGTYNHTKIDLGERSIEFETYTYPLKDFDRPGLRKTFKDNLTNAGWAVTQDAGSDSSYTATKGTTAVTVLFGEAGTEETKINVTPPKTGSAAAPPVADTAPAPTGGAVVFAGSYSSIWGPVTLEQSKATPEKVTGKYSKGTVSCAATDKKLECTWAERGAIGRCVWTKSDNGDLPGTWGNGGSSTGGGAWNLKLTKAGELN